jgi:hypothetical protein
MFGNVGSVAPDGFTAYSDTVLAPRELGPNQPTGPKSPYGKPGACAAQRSAGAPSTYSLSYATPPPRMARKSIPNAWHFL